MAVAGTAQRIIEKLTSAALAAFLVVMPIAGGAYAADAAPGRFLYQETRNCAEWEFVVWGEYEDLRVLRGQNAWTRIGSNTANMFCGKIQYTITCPSEARYLWVTRSGEFEVLLACYSD